MRGKDHETHVAPFAGRGFGCRKHLRLLHPRDLPPFFGRRAARRRINGGESEKKPLCGIISDKMTASPSFNVKINYCGAQGFLTVKREALDELDCRTSRLAQKFMD